jgi:Flp pilus assembly protein TadG
MRKKNLNRSQRGMAILELALVGPWFFFLFVGALDWGFLANELISVESAARTAALYTSTGSSTASDASLACTLVLGELRKLPNVGNAVTACTGTPVSVTAVNITGPDSAPASLVTVVYKSIPMIPIPGILPNQFTLTRAVKMRVRG